MFLIQILYYYSVLKNEGHMLKLSFCSYFSIRIYNQKIFQVTLGTKLMKMVGKIEKIF